MSIDADTKNIFDTKVLPSQSCSRFRHASVSISSWYHQTLAPKGKGIVVAPGLACKRWYWMLLIAFSESETNIVENGKTMQSISKQDMFPPNQMFPAKQLLKNKQLICWPAWRWMMRWLTDLRFSARSVWASPCPRCAASTMTAWEGAKQFKTMPNQP